MIALDLGKQQELDADKATQQIYFTRHLDLAGKTKKIFMLEKVRKTILDFSQETVRVL